MNWWWERVLLLSADHRVHLLVCPPTCPAVSHASSATSSSSSSHWSSSLISSISAASMAVMPFGAFRPLSAPCMGQEDKGGTDIKHAWSRGVATSASTGSQLRSTVVLYRHLKGTEGWNQGGGTMLMLKDFKFSCCHPFWWWDARISNPRPRSRGHRRGAL